MCFTTVSRAVSRGWPTVPTQFLQTPLNAPGCPARDSHGHNAQGMQTDAQAFFEQLSQLMAWRQAGLLSDSEFANAKRALGL